jgi:hypothetical protein
MLEMTLYRKPTVLTMASVLGFFRMPGTNFRPLLMPPK